MKIEIWSDFVCPFCYIGKRQLDEALKQFEHKDKVTVEYKSYELRPDIAVNTGQSMAEMLASKFNITIEQAKERLAGIKNRAAEEGLEFNFDNMIPTNTFNAHRLAKFAETKGKDAELTEAVLEAYFTSSKHIGDVKVLTELALAAGLDKSEVEEVLADESKFSADVRADQARARELGINGVPHFLVDGKHPVAGSQSVEKFLELLNSFWAESAVDKSSETIVGEGCVDDNCAIPQK